MCCLLIFRLVARCVFFGPDADYFFGSSGCGVYHFILVPVSVACSGVLGFTLLPRTFAGYACCRLLKYVSYGETSIVDDWVGLHSL